MSRVRDTFHLDLSLAALFEAPTIAGLSARIDDARPAREEKIDGLVKRMKSMTAQERQRLLNEARQAKRVAG